jgi:hypothetical protein
VVLVISTLARVRRGFLFRFVLFHSQTQKPIGSSISSVPSGPLHSGTGRSTLNAENGAMPVRLDVPELSIIFLMILLLWVWGTNARARHRTRRR